MASLASNPVFLSRFCKLSLQTHVTGVARVQTMKKAQLDPSKTTNNVMTAKTASRYRPISWFTFRWPTIWGSEVTTIPLLPQCPTLPAPSFVAPSLSPRLLAVSVPLTRRPLSSRTLPDLIAPGRRPSRPASGPRQSAPWPCRGVRRRPW